MSFTTMLIVLGILLVLNINSFLFMANDKRKAKLQHGSKPNTRRTPEKTLFLMTGLFGGLGGCLGMYLCRHKTNHWYFALFFPIMLVLQLVILGGAYWFFFLR